MNNKGKLYEIKAADLLRRKKYKLLETNYTTRFGEIDLIVCNRKYICFVEVKQRELSSPATPAEYVTKAKQSKIVASAQLYLSSNPTKLQPRFDIVEVYTDKGEIKSVKHLENAFDLV